MVGLPSSSSMGKSEESREGKSVALQLPYEIKIWELPPVSVSSSTNRREFEGAVGVVLLEVRVVPNRSWSSGVINQVGFIHLQKKKNI